MDENVAEGPVGEVPALTSSSFAGLQAIKNMQGRPVLEALANIDEAGR